MNVCTVANCERAVKYAGYCQGHYSRVRRHGNPRANVPLADKRRGREPRTTSELTPDMLYRFWVNVPSGEGCLEWRGSISEYGYGYIVFDAKRRLAHRIAYELSHGDIPAGAMIDHACGNRACVNAGHLRLATAKQNGENLTKLRADNTSGYRGVVYIPRKNKWAARVQHHGRTVSCGYHATPEEAAEAARLKRNELFTHNDLDRAA